MRRVRRFTAAMLSVVMITTFVTGCGSSLDDGKKDNITLDEPVGAAAEYAVVSERAKILN